MPGSKRTVMTREQMRDAVARGEDRSDWERVHRNLAQDPQALEDNRQIGELAARVLARKRGRPVQGEAKAAISLRVPVSVLERWKATGPGWQTRMVQCLAAEPVA